MAVTVIVNRKAADRARSGHPWLFASDVTDRGGAAPGDTVQVLDPRRQLLGTAHYSSTSQITLRLLSNRAEPVDEAFFEARLQQALAYRQRVVRNADSYRLVYGEADGLPGLVIDRYAGVLVLQTLTQAMDRAKPVLVPLLQRILEPRAIVERNDVAVRSREELPLQKGVLTGELPGPVAVAINGLQLTADPLGGQKTGIYLDQRENYAAAGQYAHGRALDCFTSTGGFALHMAPHCTSVDAVDSSAEALATASANAARNGLTNVEFQQADVFDFLTQQAAARRTYSTIVLDPPAFAKSRQAIEGAMRGYKEINQRALRMLEPGGILVTCSCSHHVSEALLFEAVAQASLDAHRTLVVRERRTQAQDHPILLTVPETHYLKCLIFEVAPR